MSARAKTITTCLAALVCLALPASAFAAEEFDKFAIESLSVELSNRQAGAHPDMTIAIVLTHNGNSPYANTRDAEVRLPPGMSGNPKAAPTCTAEELGNTEADSACPFDAQVGTTRIHVIQPVPGTYTEPLYNMPAPKGMVARLGFMAVGWPAFINVRLDPTDHSLVSTVEGIPSASGLFESTTTLWGVPASPIHDEERVTPHEALHGETPEGGRSVNLPEKPFLVNPTECTQERQITVTARSYQLPEQPSTMSAPFPRIFGCSLLGLNPTVALKPTTTQGTTGSGLDYELNLPDEGLLSPTLNYDSELKRAEVILPQGMSINPSEAEGLGICSEADLARETYDSGPDAGCPETSKIGNVVAESPVLDQKGEGSLYLAKPYENPFGSLLALYMVVKIPDRGVLVKLAGKVSTDPNTGQITTSFNDIPQLPVANFHLHFREGARAPLITPPTCGTHTALSNFNPWSAPESVLTKANSFQIESGPNHGPCPTGGLPPFRPDLLAGTLNNAAGTFSPFDVKITRTDAEQEITHFSVKLPPGLVAKLAGVPFCPEAGIAQAKARKGPHGGEEELNSPSCPAASQIGTSSAGSGVGDVLVYVPGKIYLAGPYHGSPLSIVAITAAKAGPFDLGTVVIREALQVNPETGEAFIDATGSDPIPHIIQGIPVHLRDIRAYVDRPQFTLNPTDCTRTSTASTLLGAGLDFASEADDRPITITSPFQAADCAALPFKPRLSLKLLGGTRRGQFPRLRAFLRMNGFGEAGIARAQVTLPSSEFIANAHFNTICTRVQFKQLGGNGEACPAGSIYGWAKAKTPILSEALEGPIFLRSSEHQLPDVVASLRGQEINVHLVGHVDSVKGRLRNTFETVPDAPVEWASFSFQGGKKGLFENSTNLCQGTHKAIVAFSGQNGKEHDFNPAVKAKCAKGRKGKKRKRR
jgi:hypothetical protein